MHEIVEIRTHGNPDQPTLVYLPGLHGDWTLVGGFRRELADRTRFVEMTYPRTLTWSLDEYAAAIESALAENGITEGWLLGESFGSQVLWALVKRGNFRAKGIILAGGFVRYPIKLGVLGVERLASGIPFKLVLPILFAYARVAKARFGNAPEMITGVAEFIARRTEEDRKAATHRLRLIAQNDPTSIAKACDLPVFAFTGWLDPIVPWVFVRRWLQRNCQNLKAYEIIRGADHTVLATSPKKAADLVCAWMQVASQT